MHENSRTGTGNRDSPIQNGAYGQYWYTFRIKYVENAILMLKYFKYRYPRAMVNKFLLNKLLLAFMLG